MLCLARTTIQAEALVTQEDSLSVNSDELQNDIQKINDHYQSLYQTGRFNGNILIATKGQIVYEKSFGYAVKSSGEKLDKNSTFQLASTSKPFTAAAILILQEQGKLDIDDLVTQYYPNFPYKRVTIRNLLSHRSGIPDYLTLGKYFPQKYISNQDVMKMFEIQRPRALNTPNTVFRYNNSNFAVLAALVEKISGESFPDFLKEHIFEPLHMNNTWVWHPNQGIKDDQTLGYDYAWRPRESDKFDGVYGDKGVYSTAEDLLKWDQSWYTHLLLKPKTIALAYTGQTGGREKDYGLGWRMHYLDNDKKLIFHNGWWHDYNIVFKRFIDDSLTIIILSNKYNQSVYNTDFVENRMLDNQEPDPAKSYYASVVSHPKKVEQKKESVKNPESIEVKNLKKIIDYNPFGSKAKEADSEDNFSQKVNDVKYYIVKKGDTLYNIAQRFQVTIDMLKKWNKIASVNIFLGQKLLIDNIIND